jgi:hypothetical protein
MKYAVIAGIVAVLVAAVFVLSAVPTVSLGKSLGISTASDHQLSGEKDKQWKGNDTEANETEDNDTGESEMANATLIAGGLRELDLQLAGLPGKRPGRHDPRDQLHGHRL